MRPVAGRPGWASGRRSRSHAWFRRAEGQGGRRRGRTRVASSREKDALIGQVAAGSPAVVPAGHEIALGISNGLDATLVARPGQPLLDRRSLARAYLETSQPPGLSSWGASRMSRCRMRTPSGPPSNARRGSCAAIWSAFRDPSSRYVRRVACHKSTEPSAGFDANGSSRSPTRSVTRSSSPRKAMFRARARSRPARSTRTRRRRVRERQDTRHVPGTRAHVDDRDAAPGLAHAVHQRGRHAGQQFGLGARDRAPGPAMIPVPMNDCRSVRYARGTPERRRTTRPRNAPRRVGSTPAAHTPPPSVPTSARLPPAATALVASHSRSRPADPAEPGVPPRAS